MVETGIVKFYNRKKQFGFIIVLDEHGEKTSEELFFSFSQAVYPKLSGAKLCVDLVGHTERGYQRLRFPRTDDKVVFKVELDVESVRTDVGRNSVPVKAITSWTYLGLWEDEERKLLTVPFAYRVIRESWEEYNPYRNGRYEPGGFLRTIATGTALLNDIQTFTAETFGLYKSNSEEVDLGTYAIEVWFDDDWLVRVKKLTLREHDGIGVQ